MCFVIGSPVSLFSKIRLLLCDKTLPGETLHTHLLTPARDFMADQSTYTTKTQLGEPMSFTGVTYRNMGERLLMEICMRSCFQEHKLRQKHQQSPTPAWVVDNKSREPGAHCTACRLLNRLESAFSRWSKVLLG